MKRNLATADTVIYKGRRYGVLFIGNTKYGPRAHLEYLDGTKDFWIDADLVTDPRDDLEDTDHGLAARAAANEEADPQDLMDEANAINEDADDYSYEPPPPVAAPPAPKRQPAPRKRRAAPAAAGDYNPYAFGS
jgi:hypothetical protein